MADSLTANATHFILREFVGDVLLFPVWWYGHGLARVGTFTLQHIAEFTNRSRWSPKVWFQNLFVPMYGDYSRSGRAISFAVRFVVASALTVTLAFAVALYLALFVLYFILPVAVVYFLLHEIFNFPWPA